MLIDIMEGSLLELWMEPINDLRQHWMGNGLIENQWFRLIHFVDNFKHNTFMIMQTKLSRKRLRHSLASIADGNLERIWRITQE